MIRQQKLVGNQAWTCLQNLHESRIRGYYSLFREVANTFGVVHDGFRTRTIEDAEFVARMMGREHV